jgi:DNA-binding NtrC family response regulator
VALEVLIVADDPTVVGLLAAACAADGHSVASCTSFPDARAHLAARPVHLLIVHGARSTGAATDLVRSAVRVQSGLQALLLADDPTWCPLEEALACGANNQRATPISREALRSELQIAAARRHDAPLPATGRAALRAAAAQIVAGFHAGAAPADRTTRLTRCF